MPKNQGKDWEKVWRSYLQYLARKVKIGAPQPVFWIWCAIIGSEGLKFKQNLKWFQVWWPIKNCFPGRIVVKLYLRDHLWLDLSSKVNGMVWRLVNLPLLLKMQFLDKIRNFSYKNIVLGVWKNGLAWIASATSWTRNFFLLTPIIHYRYS